MHKVFAIIAVIESKTRYREVRRQEDYRQMIAKGGIVVGGCFNCHMCGETKSELEKYCTISPREEDKVCWCVCPNCRDSFLQRSVHVVIKAS